MFTDFNGNTWTNKEVQAYDQFTWEINRTKNPDVREFLLDQRHRFFVMVLDSYRVDKQGEIQWLK